MEDERKQELIKAHSKRLLQVRDYLLRFQEQKDISDNQILFWRSMKVAAIAEIDAMQKQYAAVKENLSKLGVIVDD